MFKLNNTNTKKGEQYDVIDFFLMSLLLNLNIFLNFF